MGDKRITQLMNQSITEVFVEQPLASPGPAKNMVAKIVITLIAVEEEQRNVAS